MGHADRQALEVRELGGQTNGVRVDEHPVAGLATDAVHLEDTALLHVTLDLGEEVLAETNRPAGLHLVEELDVLIHKPVDLVDRVGNLDVLGGEDEGDLAGTGTHTLVLADLDVSAGAHSLEEITDGSEATALALGDVVGDLVSSSGGVRLEGQVVVGDLLAVALDELEHIVGHALDLLGSEGLETTGSHLDVLRSTVLNSLGTGLT